MRWVRVDVDVDHRRSRRSEWRHLRRLLVTARILHLHRPHDRRAPHCEDLGVGYIAFIRSQPPPGSGVPLSWRIELEASVISFFMIEVVSVAL